MKSIFPSFKIYVSSSTIPHAGRGIFASEHIKKGEIIEVCPVIELSWLDFHHIKQTLLNNYIFTWNKNRKTIAVGLGCSSLYNHSYENANATYIKKYRAKKLIYQALQDIGKDQEILVNYNSGNPHDKTPLWISDIPQP